MRFEVIAEGFVTQREPGTATATAAGARCAVTPSGDLVCTYILQSAIGVNDFKPTISRSTDGGLTWTEQGRLWPRLQDRWAIFGSVSRSLAGELFFFGSRTPIDKPGESFWNEATQGLKQNELIWAASQDGGRSWADPAVIPMPLPGSAEAPGAMCITSRGRWLVCYAPYNTFDPNVTVERNQIVALRSSNRGRSWMHTAMLRFKEDHSGGAEAWVIELSDGRLLGTSWHFNAADGSDFPNAFALSKDGGITWSPTSSTGIMGQSTGLAALPGERALFVYNQRKHADPGVWLALVKPTAADFGVECNEVVWRAEKTTQSGSSGQHLEWKDFSFGEPSVTVLPDDTLLVTLWCIQPSGRGIRYVKLKMRE